MVLLNPPGLDDDSVRCRVVLVLVEAVLVLVVSELLVVVEVVGLGCVILPNARATCSPN